MTHDSILALVDDVNSSNACDRIFLRPLTSNVDFALVWKGEPQGSSSDEGSHRFYFIRDTTGHCIGAIEDLVGDIHAVLKEEYRNRRVMTAVMRDVVLPHIFASGRAVQHTQIFSSGGRALAIKLGFQFTGADCAELRADQAARWTQPRIQPAPLSPYRVEANRKNIRAAALCLREAQSQLKDRSSPSVYDDLGFGAYAIDDLLSESIDPDCSETAPPSQPPLDETSQQAVEKLIYRSAAFLRMAADELDERERPERVADIRKIAQRVITIGQNVRDDWRDLQFKHRIRNRNF